MKAIVYDRYGPPEVMRPAEVPRPEPGASQVLIRVRAASVNRSDWETLTGRPAYVRISGTGLRRPKNPILGSDLAGEVEAVGAEVTRFRPGDEVVADTLYAGHGAFAEYVAVSERAPITTKPPGLSFENAAALPQAAVLAYQGLRRQRPVAPGDRVLINGAGGGAGSFAVQLAKAAGAEVTGVDSGPKQDLMRSLGADHVLDYTTQTYVKSGPFDRILDFVGARGLLANRRALQPDGSYSVVGGSVPRILAAAAIGPLLSRFGDRSLGLFIGRPNADDLAEVARLAAAGELTPAIDRVYRLPDVPAALARVGAAEALGKLVITV